MSELNTWSTTAASNNATPPNGFPEGMAPSTVNDAAREVMAAVARYRSDTDGVNTSSGTNTIALAASRTMTAYAQGDLYTFKAGGTNTGATTLNVDSLGAKDVQFNGAACVGGEIVSGLMYTVVYDGTQFQLLNASSYPAIDITTLEVTNIKAKDGTASATIANSTGVMTISSAVISAGSAAFSAPSTSTVDSTSSAFAITANYSGTGGGSGLEVSSSNAADIVVINSSYGGIASPNYAALRVTSTGTLNAICVEDSTNPDSTPFIVNNAGQLIQGYTTTVASKIITTALTPAAQIQGATAGNSSAGIYNWANNSSFSGSLIFNKSKSGTIGTLSAVTDGDSFPINWEEDEPRVWAVI